MSLQTILHTWRPAHPEAVPVVEPFTVGREGELTGAAAVDSQAANVMQDTGPLPHAEDAWVPWQDGVYIDHFRLGLMRKIGACIHLPGCSEAEVLATIDALSTPSPQAMAAAELLLQRLNAVRPNVPEQPEFTEEERVNLVRPDYTPRQERQDMVRSLRMAERYNPNDMQAVATLRSSLAAFDAVHPELLQ